MEIIRSIRLMQSLAEDLKKSGKRLGLVPTMGYLHQGHLSLLDAIRSRCDVLIASIFVNPTQFGPGEDFTSYPRDFQRDERLLRENDCDILFYPEKEEMYPEGFATKVIVEGLTDELCGRSRPTHFAGVATVVAKLFNITGCDIACFGQKDGQQAAVIKRMARDLNIPVEIVVAPIVREPDGLALSSRNVYLSEPERKRSLCLKKSLDLAERLVAEGERDSKVILHYIRDIIELVEGAEIDYIEIVDAETMKEAERIKGKVMVALAVRFGKTRLIDNCLLEVSEENVE